jgi:hypothetical protein
MKRTFQALATIVSLSVDDDVPGAELVWMLVAGYPDVAADPELAFHLRGGSHPALECTGRYETRVEEPDDLVPLFELDLYHSLVELAPKGWVLHAAAVERDGRAIVLAGPSGAGKTTLMLALIARGMRMSTDEIVHIDPNGVVHGLARPVHSAAAVSSGHPIPPDWQRRPYPLRGHRGEAGLLVQPPIATRTTTPQPLEALVRIGHGADCNPSIELLPPHRALPRLWECTLRRDDDGLAAATALLASYRALDLVASSVAQSVSLIEQLINT